MLRSTCVKAAVTGRFVAGLNFVQKGMIESGVLPQGPDEPTIQFDFLKLTRKGWMVAKFNIHPIAASGVIGETQTSLPREPWRIMCLFSDLHFLESRGE